MTVLDTHRSLIWPTAEFTEFRQSLRSFLHLHGRLEMTRRSTETPEGFDVDLWRRLNDELGICEAVSPSADSRDALAALSVVSEELGRVLYSGPYLSTAGLSLSLIRHADTGRDGAEVIADVAAGTPTTVLADVGAELTGGYVVKLGSAKPASGYTATISVDAPRVLHASAADMMLLTAVETADRVDLYTVPAADAGVEVADTQTLDTTRRLGAVKLREAQVEHIGYLSPVSFERAFATAHLALASEMVGAADACLEMSLAYAKTRHQFGRPIGSFQAIRHKCADMAIAIETSRAIIAAAAVAIWAGREDCVGLARMAKACASDALEQCAAENLHIHGAMGFTWEHDSQLYYRRSKVDAALFGRASSLRLETGANLLGPGASDTYAKPSRAACRKEDSL